MQKGEEEDEVVDVRTFFASLAPERACGLLRNARFFTRDWSSADDGNFRCESLAIDAQTREVPFDPLASTLAYTVVGDATSVETMVLDLEVPHPSAVATGHTKLLEVTSVLFLKLARRRLPRAFNRAIVEGRRTEEHVEGLLLTVTPSQTSPAGAYGVRVTITLSPAAAGHELSDSHT